MGFKRSGRFRLLYCTVALVMAGLVLVQVYWIITHVRLQKNTLEQRLEDELPGITKIVEEEAFCQNFHSKTYLREHESLYIIKYSPLSGQRDTIDRYRLSVNEKKSFLHAKLYPVTDPAAVDLGVKLRFFRSNPHMRWQDTSQYLQPQAADRPIHIAKMIDLHLLDSLVKKTFVRAGLDTVYAISIKKEGNRLIDYSSTSDTLAAGSNLIRTTFLKGNDFKPYELMIRFPDPYTRILSSMLAVLLSSLLFIAVLVVAYVYFVRLILNNDKFSEMKNVFIDNTTHEFKTPITNINLAVDNWRFSRDNADFYMNIIEEENKNLERKVEQILEISSLETKFTGKNNDREPVDLHGTIHGVVNLFGQQLKKLGARVEYNFSAKNHFVSANRQQLTNVFHNLVDNAIKYRGPHPHIVFSSRNTGNRVVISIQDNGIGMKPEVQKYIFDKFYRENSGDVHNTKGFGLGLNYVKYIIGLYSGSIQVKSKKGEGTVFTIVLNT